MGTCWVSICKLTKVAICIGISRPIGKHGEGGGKSPLGGAISSVINELTTIITPYDSTTSERTLQQPKPNFKQVQAARHHLQISCNLFAKL